jgi:hypothetical protein
MTLRFGDRVCPRGHADKRVSAWKPFVYAGLFGSATRPPFCRRTSFLLRDSDTSHRRKEGSGYRTEIVSLAVVPTTTGVRIGTKEARRHLADRGKQEGKMHLWTRKWQMTKTGGNGAKKNPKKYGKLI